MTSFSISLWTVKGSLFVGIFSYRAELNNLGIVLCTNYSEHMYANLKNIGTNESLEIMFGSSDVREGHTFINRQYRIDSIFSPDIPAPSGIAPSQDWQNSITLVLVPVSNSGGFESNVR